MHDLCSRNAVEEDNNDRYKGGGRKFVVNSFQVTRELSSMEALTRASALTVDIAGDLEALSLQGCERLRRCISEIVPLLDNLRTMKSPWGPSTVRALSQLHEALERVQDVVRTCVNSVVHFPQQDCDLLTSLRQLWQRQIEMNLAIRFQQVLEDTKMDAFKAGRETMTPSEGLVGDGL